MHANAEVIRDATPIWPLYDEDPYRLETRTRELHHLKLDHNYE